MKQRATLVVQLILYLICLKTCEVRINPKSFCNFNAKGINKFTGGTKNHGTVDNRVSVRIKLSLKYRIKFFSSGV